jgi:cell shape-determining protein MreD
MRYLLSIFFWLVAIYIFSLLNLYQSGWQYVQPFLIVILLTYFNSEDHWLYYSLSILSGLYIDSLNGIFGVYSIIFLLILFILKILQNTWLTSKNFLSIVILTILAFVLFWFFFWLINSIFDWQIYIFNQQAWWLIFKNFILFFCTTLIIHLLIYNFWVRRHERQSL